MNFPIESVPLPRQTQPFQQPKTYDPADVIMQAAHLRLQDEALKQKQLEDLTGVIDTAAQLMEHRRHNQAEEAQAKALLDLHAKMQPAQMAELEAKTELTKAQVGMFSSGDISGIASYLLKREALPPEDPQALPPGTTMNIFPRFGTSRLALLNAYANNPSAGFSKAAIGYEGAKTETKTLHGSTVQQRVLGGESILPNFQDVIDQAKTLGLSAFAPSNKIKLAYLRQINDPGVRKYDTLRNAVSEEMARYFGGGVSSDYKIRLGQSILGDDGANAEAIENALVGKGGAYSVIKNQVEAFKGKKVLSQSSAPEPGLVKNGYRFKGGKPSDPANWEKL